jgi:hypothetical protein
MDDAIRFGVRQRHRLVVGSKEARRQVTVMFSDLVGSAAQSG